MRLTLIAITAALLALLCVCDASAGGPQCSVVDGKAFCCVNGRLQRTAIKVDCLEAAAIFANCGGGSVSICSTGSRMYWQMPCDCICRGNAAGTCWFSLDCNPLDVFACCYWDQCDDPDIVDLIPACIDPTVDCSYADCFTNDVLFDLEYGACDQ